MAKYSKEIDVRAYIEQLRRALPYVPPIPVKKIKALHNNGDFGGVVKLIRSTMNVDVGLTLHWTTTPPREMPNAPAWITMPAKMPYYGTDAFKELKLEIFIMKPFANTAPFDQFAMAIAHELSHIVLDSIEHPLRREEKAVDLTAMILGFSYLYRKAAHTLTQVGYNQYQRNQLGYLSQAELDTACSILLPSRLRVLRLALLTAQHFAGLLILAAVFGIVTISLFAYDKWQLQQRLVEEAAALRSNLPMNVGPSTVLIGARVGILSLTSIYRVVLRSSNVDLVTFEQRLRAGACSEHRSNIDSGATYRYQYETEDRNLSFEFSSCP